VKRTLVILFLCLATFVRAADKPKPRVAVLPISGDASEHERERAGFSIRAKLDRQGVYEPIDGPTMLELAGDRTIAYDTPADQVRALVSDEKPDVIIWGAMGKQLRLHILDLRHRDAKPIDYVADINHATDVRFAVEKLIEQMPGSQKFEHMTEEAVVHDDQAESLWKSNPNLAKEGTFDAPGDWRGMLAADKYPPKVVDRAPEPDEVVIRRVKGDGQVLAMQLSKATAESYGLACLGGKIPIEPGVRYRMSFRYKSDGPTIRPFIKGYVMLRVPERLVNLSMGTIPKCVLPTPQEREIYRRQVPPRGDTHGAWVNVLDEMNPQQRTFPVEFLRVDLYAYLHEGTVEFDDIVIKAVGEQTRNAKDDAIDLPVEKK
jgi:hypothetical protein